MFFLPNPNLEAQTQVVNRTKVEKVHKVKRKVRRHNRRVERRTLRRLPKGTKAIMHRKVAYYPVGGMFYIARKGVYVRSFPRPGFRVRILPRTAIRIVVRSGAYRYADGVFYQQIGDEYEIVAPPKGAVVYELPVDAEEIDFDGIPAYELNDAVYKAVQDGYEIIDVLEEED